MFPDETETNRLFTDADPKGLSGLSLAFIGDAVYELLIRRYILSNGEAKVSTLHNEAVKLVNADYQADMAEMLLPLLTEEETAVFKRGRNAHSAHTPKNKSEAQYHKSTGFEALIGYLYLKKDTVRLNEIFSVILLQGEENE